MDILSEIVQLLNQLNMDIPNRTLTIPEIHTYVQTHGYELFYNSLKIIEIHFINNKKVYIKTPTDKKCFRAWIPAIKVKPLNT
jgi:hypothetical protein